MNNYYFMSNVLDLPGPDTRSGWLNWVKLLL